MTNINYGFFNSSQDADTLTGKISHSSGNENDASEDKAGTPKKLGLLSFAFYQQLFDVETHQILRRLLGAVTPNPKINFLHDILRPTPDMYGPFWICTTLIFIIAMSGNISSYMYSQGSAYTWHYDFKKVTLASTMVYVYWWLGPVLVWATLRILKSRRLHRSGSGEDELQSAALLDNFGDLEGENMSQMNLDFIDLLAVFGYSFAVLVPVSILWIIQHQVLQWILCVIATSISAGLVVCTFWTDFSRKNKKVATILGGVILGLQFLFAVSLMFLFFSTAPIFDPHVASGQDGASDKALVVSSLVSNSIEANATSKN